MLRQFIESRINDFRIVSFDRFPDVRDFLRPLIDQKDDQMDLRIIVLDRTRHILDQGRLARLGRGNDHASLSLADGAHQVHNAHGNTAACALETNPLIRKYRSHILEIITLGGFIGGIAVHALDIEQGAEFFPLRLHADIP